MLAGGGGLHRELILDHVKNQIKSTDISNKKVAVQQTPSK